MTIRSMVILKIIDSYAIFFEGQAAWYPLLHLLELRDNGKGVSPALASRLTSDIGTIAVVADVEVGFFIEFRFSYIISTYIVSPPGRKSSSVLATSVIRPDFWSNTALSHSTIRQSCDLHILICFLPNAWWCFPSFQLITNPSMMACGARLLAPCNAIRSGSSIRLCPSALFAQELIQISVQV